MRKPKRIQSSVWIGVAFFALLFTGCTARAKAERQIKRGDTYFAAKQFDKAKIEYLSALQNDSAQPELFEKLGLTFFELAEFGPAFSALTRAKEKNPENLAVRVSLGTIYLRAGDLAKAHEEANFILDRDQQHGEALVMLAVSCTNEQEVATVRRRLEAILPQARTNAFLHLAVGHTLLRSKEYKAAESSFLKAVELQPASPRIHTALAAVYVIQGATNLAEKAYQKSAELSPPRSSQRLHWAEFMFRTGRVEQGKNILESALKEEPKFPAALNILAELALSERKTNDCAAFLAKTFAIDPSNFGALLVRSRLNLFRRDFAASIRDLDMAERLAPRDASVYYRKALVRIASNDPAAALTDVEKAISLNPRNLDALLLRAELQIQKGDFASAVPLLQRTVQVLTNNLRAHYLLASAYRLRGNPNESLAVYSQISTFAPRDPQAPYLAAVILRSQNRTNEARQFLERSLLVAPTFVPAIDDIIDLDLAEGNSPAALKRVEGYINDFPQKPVPWWFRAKIHASQNRLKEAESDLRKALEVDPDYKPAHQSLVQLQVATGRKAEAVSQLEAILKKNSRDFRSYFQLGSLHEALGDKGKAIQAYESSLKANPQYGLALNNLSYLLSETGRDAARAEDLARQARSVLPGDPAVADTYGWILFKRGEYEKALPLIQEAADKLGKQPVIQFHLGSVLYQSGHQDGSRVAFGNLVGTNAPVQLREEAEASLRVLGVNPENASADSIAFLEARLKSNERDLFAVLRLAQIHNRHGKSGESEEYFKQALAINPKASVVLASYALFCLNANGDKERALSLANEAWASRQNPAEAFDLARVAFGAGNSKFAALLLAEADRFSPRNPAVKHLLALANFSLARFSQALENAKESASILGSPQLPAARELATVVQFCLDSADGARAERAALSLLSAEPNSLPALTVLGLVHEQRKEFDKARAFFEKAAALEPQALPPRRSLAILLTDHFADDARAFELASALRSEFGGDYQLSRSLGKIAYRRGDYKDAVRLLKESQLQAQSEKDADLLYHLGMAQFKAGDKTSREALAEALKLNPGARLADEAQKALAQLD